MAALGFLGFDLCGKLLDKGKRVAETFHSECLERYGVRVRVARSFNTHAPYGHPDDRRVVSNFIVQALSANLATRYGDGSQARSFCYVDDTEPGLLLSMRKPAVGDFPINLGNPDERLIGELAAVIRTPVGDASPLVNMPLPADDPMQRRPDISRSVGQLSGFPPVALLEGLWATMQYFSEVVGQTSKTRIPLQPTTMSSVHSIGADQGLREP